MSRVGDLIDSGQPWYRAAAAGVSDTLPIPLREIMNPDTCPVPFLPWLAAHRGVQLWFSDWPVPRMRSMIKNWPRLAQLIGTRASAPAFLPYVDAELVDRISYPKPFVFGRGVIGRTPIGHPPHVARYLIRLLTYTPPRAFVFGRAVLGRAVLKVPSFEPFERVLIALRVCSAPEAEIRVNWEHMRPLTIDDAPILDGTHRLGDHVPRHKL